MKIWTCIDDRNAGRSTIGGCGLRVDVGLAGAGESAWEYKFVYVGADLPTADDGELLCGAERVRGAR